MVGVHIALVCLWFVAVATAAPVADDSENLVTINFEKTGKSAARPSELELSPEAQLEAAIKDLKMLEKTLKQDEFDNLRRSVRRIIEFLSKNRALVTEHIQIDPRNGLDSAVLFIQTDHPFKAAQFEKGKEEEELSDKLVITTTESLLRQTA